MKEKGEGRKGRGGGGIKHEVLLYVPVADDPKVSVVY